MAEERSTETRLALLENSIPRIERNTERILEAIEGVGNDDGMKTSIALNRDSIKRLWKTLGLGGTSVMAAVCSVVVKVIFF